MIKEINFSKKAVERINQLIAKKPSGTFFRIAINGGGCSGFKYDFCFDTKIDDSDFDTAAELKKILRSADDRIKKKYKLDNPEMFEKIAIK